MTPAERLARKKPYRRLSGEGQPRCGKIDSRVKEIRRGLRLSLQDVAKATGLAVSTIQVIENGADLRLTTAYRLSKLFGMPVTEIWKAKR